MGTTQWPDPTQTKQNWGRSSTLAVSGRRQEGSADSHPEGILQDPPTWGSGMQWLMGRRQAFLGGADGGRKQEMPHARAVCPGGDGNAFSYF